MRYAVLVVAAFVLFMSAGTLHADAPPLETGMMIQDGPSPLSVDRHSSPCIVDWNNDGRKDVVISQFYYGYVWLFLNQGTDLNPVFSGGSQIKSSGSTITTSYG